MNNQHKMHTPVKVANGQKVSNQLRSGQRLTSLWSGHRPLTETVHGFLEETRQNQADHCADHCHVDRSGHQTGISSGLPLGASTPELSSSAKKFSPSTSASDLCSQGSVCSLQIDSGIGSEAASVLGSSSQLVSSDYVDNARNQTHHAPHKRKGVPDCSADLESSPPPSDDDSGISEITQHMNRRGSDSITLHTQVSLDSEVEFKSQTVDHPGRIACPQGDGKNPSKQCPLSTPTTDAPSDKYQNSRNSLDKINSKQPKLPQESACAKYSSCRWVLAYLCFLARFMQTALRQSLGIAIIGMTLKIAERVVTPDAGWEAWEADMARNDTGIHRDNLSSSSSGSSSREPVFLNLVRNGSTWKWTDENGHNWTMVVSMVSTYL
ncbi:hypothetical protein ElyMa_006215700 [Elysia marginata]|uniref:Uncharacterized protein n=1 Tax=Elysia marginata TaxID=1093978 RepID=A0AAV4H535_9GAST|nr:hypothetical protein ElyMa_006215700 [Elysia marginata]